MTTGVPGGRRGAPRARRAYACGFTLIEVMVALVIVAFGMGAVLASLSSAAGNIAALHDKTLAQWIALNLVADTRLNLQVPTTGTTEGDVKAFGNADWHWQQDIVPVSAIPGLLEITVRVRRIGTNTGSSSSSSSSSSSGSGRLGGSTSLSGSGSLGGSGTFGGSGTLGNSGSSGTFGNSGSFGSSSGGGTLGFASSSGSSLGSVASNISMFASGSANQNWLATVIGFRGDAVAPSSGEAPDWTGTSFAGVSSSSSSGATSSSGAILNPGTNPGGSSLTGSSSGASSPVPVTPGSNSSGGG